jgi:hypothetical protein
MNSTAGGYSARVCRGGAGGPWSGVIVAGFKVALDQF